MESDTLAAAVDNVAVDDVENAANFSTLKKTPLVIEEKGDKNLSNDVISVVADEQIQQNEPTKEGEINLDKVTNVTEIPTEAPQNSGDGGNLSVAMPQHSESHASPGHSNVSIKKRRHVHVLVYNKREILPRKSKTKAYEYIKNIARGLSVAANAGYRRRVQRKRLTRNLIRNKTSLPRNRDGWVESLNRKRSTVSRSRIGICHSGTSISSGLTQITGSSNASSSR